MLSFISLSGIFKGITKMMRNKQKKFLFGLIYNEKLDHKSSRATKSSIIFSDIEAYQISLEQDNCTHLFKSC